MSLLSFRSAASALAVLSAWMARPMVVLASLFAWSVDVPVARAQDIDGGGVPSISVNGPRRAVVCPALLDGGAALCFAFPAPAKAAKRALVVAPLAETWKQALEETTHELAESRKSTAAAEKVAEERTEEARRYALAHEAQKTRADKLEAASKWSWLKTLLKIALPTAGAGALGFALGRYVR